MNAEFRCLRNDDGTCQGQVTIDGEHAGARWRVNSGTPADLQRLYLNFVVEHMVCPTIQKPCEGCMPPEFIAKVKEIVEWAEGDLDTAPH